MAERISHNEPLAVFQRKMRISSANLTVAGLNILLFVCLRLLNIYSVMPPEWLTLPIFFSGYVVVTIALWVFVFWLARDSMFEKKS